MEVRLVIERGARRRTLKLRSATSIVGRARGNAVRIPSAEVSRQHCRLRVKDGVVEVSQIFDWYADDFKADGGPIAFCKKWGRTDLPSDAKVEFIPYDWSLNAQPGRALFDP